MFIFPPKPGKVPILLQLRQDVQFHDLVCMIDNIVIDYNTNNIIVTFFGTNLVVVLNDQFQVLYSFKLVDDDEKIIYPSYVAIDSYNRLLVTSKVTNRIYVFSLAGDYLTSIHFKMNHFPLQIWLP